MMCFLHIYEYETLKPVKVILRRGRRKENRGTLNTNMEISQ
jgi:hypothetical protein